MLNKKFRELLDDLENKPRSSTDSILLIDGLNTFLRSFTVINHINSNGHHIGGLTGALKSIGYAIRLINPTYVVVVFDGVASTSNKRNLFPEYKANRHKNRSTNYTIFGSKEEEDESVRNQIERLIQYLKCLPVSLISVDGLEADDIIGYLVDKFEKNSNTEKITIMSADKDFLQLVSKKTQIYSPTKKKIYQPKDVLEEYGISSNNFLMQKILLGDKSDNIPGIVGLGPKKLIKLFPELGEEKSVSLNEILLKSTNNIDDNNLYLSICSFAHQLDINNKLMNLKENFISEENKGYNKRNDYD
jgi:DNA polymerase-1